MAKLELEWDYSLGADRKDLEPHERYICGNVGSGGTDEKTFQIHFHVQYNGRIVQ